MTEQLVPQMKIVLASVFSFYLKAHNFHWNVEGPNFPQYHSFFGSLYDEVFDSVDTIAEHIRTLNSYAPGSLARYSQLSVIEDQTNIPSAKAMVTELYTDNIKIISELTKAYNLAEQAKKPGLSNFLQDRINVHEKHGWQLKAISE